MGAQALARFKGKERHAHAFILRKRPADDPPFSVLNKVY
jgi:hypothetical protein